MGAPVYSLLMKRLLLIAILLFATASAQGVQRAVVVPFSGTEGFGPLAIGISAALQRALNVVDGVYVPPIGDAVLVAERAAAAGREPTPTMRELFGVEQVLEGRLLLRNNALVLELRLGDAVREIPIESDAPAESAAQVASTAFERLGLQPVAADLREVERILAETPSTPSLGPVALGSSGLPSTGLGGIEAALALDPESSWVRAEYARALALAGSTEDALVHAQRATELAPEDIEAWVVLGVVRGAAADDAGALAAFERALQLNPAHAIALVGVARHAADTSRATDALEQALAAYPRLSEAYVLLAELAPNLQRSVQVLRRATPHLPDAVSIHRQIVDRLVAAGEPAAGLSYLRDAVQAPLAPAALYALATRLPAEQVDQALAFLDQGREQNPEDGVLAAAAARLHLSAGRPQEAADVLAPMVEAGAVSDDVRNTLAIAYARLGQVEQARALFGELADEPAAQYNLGLLLLESGQADEALEIFEQLVQVEGAGADVVAYHGIALAQAGRLDEARAELERAMEMDPDLAIAQRALEQLDQRQRIGLAEVELTAEQAEAVDRGLFALDEGAWPTAVDAFAEARALGDVGALAFYHAYALQRAGRTREAVEAYQVAAEALPESSVVASNLGFAHLQLGRFDRSLAELDRALALDEENAQAHFNLGLAYYGLGRFADALAEWDRAEELQPGVAEEAADLREDARQRVQ